MSEDLRRRQLLASGIAIARLAQYRSIKAIPATAVVDDVEVRHLLGTVIRRWTKLETVGYATPAALELRRRGGRPQLEHVVPVRVLQDRMIMRPNQIRGLLATAVVLAYVTPEDHKALGGIYLNHRELYEAMLDCPVADLPHLGWQRYRRSKIRRIRLKRSDLV